MGWSVGGSADYITAIWLQDVNHHRTHGVHLQLCRGYCDGRSGANPGGEEGGQVHSRECSVEEPGKEHNCLRVLSTETAEEALLHCQEAAAVLLERD